MAGITDLPFRLIAWEFGVGLAYSEMISAMAMVHESARTKAMVQVNPAEGPLSLQIFGSEPEICARGAVGVLDLLGDRRPAAIDINMGCPTPKIVRNGEGSALMKDVPHAVAIVSAVVEALRRVNGPPVTVKMRAGWDAAHINAVEFATAVVGAGARALAVHGRTREMFYSGRADWGIIKAVKAASGVTVIGNGDVDSPEQAARLLETTGCDAVMIGRGALGNPWLIRRTARLLEGKDPGPEPSLTERIEMCRRHLHMQVEFAGARMGVLQMRKHCAWYLKGFPGAGRVKERLNRAATAERSRQCWMG
jgi:nifR3 family TIM-barrel protein